MKNCWLPFYFIYLFFLIFYLFIIIISTFGMSTGFWSCLRVRISVLSLLGGTNTAALFVYNYNNKRVILVVCWCKNANFKLI